MLEVTTNVQGQLMDHDDWRRLKASTHETPLGNAPRGRVASEDQLPATKPIERSTSLENAANNDLKVRGVPKNPKTTN